MLKTWLAHPLTRGLNIDDPHTTHVRLRIIQQKKFLRQVYQEWYRALATSLPSCEGALLELGAGGGFMAHYIPDLIASEIFYIPNIKVVTDGMRLPFTAASLRGIVMTEVLHHLPEPRLFFAEATRCVRPGGVVSMIEPWVSSWSRFIYRRLHHEAFEPDSPLWEFPSSGPLSGANGALPWIVFVRDRAKFEKEFPEWRIELIQPMMPFRYLLSGGVSLCTLAPAWSFGVWTQIERALSPWNNHVAMFAQITLRRLENPA